MSIFREKVVWITGASSGIGAELANQFSSAGAQLILSARNVKMLESVKANLARSEAVLVLPLDLEQHSNFSNSVDQVIARFGRIDILINNGGLSQRSEASETVLDIDRKIMEVNYFGTVALTKAVLPIMQRQKSGHIVAISSIAGKFGFYLRSAYSASKHALQGFFESLLLEEAKHNIHVTIAYPGKINTGISKSALNSRGEPYGKMDHSQKTGMSVEQCARKLIRAIQRKKKSVLIGKREINAVYIKRYFPSLFWKIIRKQKGS